MWIVRLTEQRMPYGPFDDRASADRFREFLTNEVDPAEVEQLLDPVTELLNWRDAMQASVSVRGGEPIGDEAEALYREEKRT